MKTIPMDMQSPWLTDAEATSSVVHPGQWRLTRVEVVNWGTFSGHQVLPVSRRGLLITGPSGSGKSTLLDAITTVLTPPGKRQLNAAARSVATKGDDRTIYSYIRGAWRHETDDTGEVANSYLRYPAATWSGILLSYEDGMSEQKTGTSSTQASKAHEPINLLVLFNLKAGSTNREGLKEIYAVVRGNHTLKDFEKYALNGIEVSKLKKDYKDSINAYPDYASFAHTFCRLMGIGGKIKTLELLHKTQAAKNFGSLDDLFRKFMLDEPQTFTQAQEAVEQFSALSQAYRGVVEQRQQMQHLEPLVQLDDDYKKALDAQIRAIRLAGALDSFTNQLIMENLQSQKQIKLREASRAAEEIQRTKSEYDQAKSELTLAEASLTNLGGFALDNANMQVLNQEQQVRLVEQNRSKLTKDLACANINSVPQSLAGWSELCQTVQDQAKEAEAVEAANKAEDYAQYGNVDKLKKEGEAINSELRHLRSQQTNIPSALHQVRVDIARHIGASMEDLPFVGELLEVKPQYQAWQGAIERLLGQQAKTMLVAQRYVKAVAAYVDETHLGLRFEYDSVPSQVEVPQRTLSEQSVTRKLMVAQHKKHPEYSNWINAFLRERYNYACVESSSELKGHTHAITIAGQIKKNNRHIKDDRHPINDRTRWVLGINNDDKIDQLIKNAQDNQREMDKANAIATAIGERSRKAHDLERLATMLDGAQWKSYDILSANEELDSARAYHEKLKKTDKKMDQARELRDEAEKRKDLADEAYLGAQVARQQIQITLADIEEKITHFAQRLKEAMQISADDQQALLKLFKKQNKSYQENTETINETARHVQSAINDDEKRAGEAMQVAQSAAERIMHDYKQTWSIRAADLSEDFVDKEAYLAIYRQIKATGLPEFEQKFLEVLHNFSQDQITVIASTIRRALKEVREKLYPVNLSLNRSEYNAGIFLQIDVKGNRGKQAEDFLDELQTIAEGTWNEDDITTAELRYKRISKIIDRLKSGEYADRMWRQSCLDTRQHVSFIAKELDVSGNVQGVHSSDAGLSGGQKQKLVIFCLAAALRYQLADEEQQFPSYGTVILDEAFDKADYSFAATAMNIFHAFGFHMVLATPLKLLRTLEPYIGEIAAVHCEESKHSLLQIVSIDEESDSGVKSKPVASQENEVVS